jgi:hypothetical protein
MISFLDFNLINTHIDNASYDFILYDSALITEAVAAFYHAMTVMTLQSPRAKMMRIVSIGGDGLSSLRAALLDHDGLECLQNLPAAAGECLDIEQNLDIYSACHLTNLTLLDATSLSDDIDGYGAML